MTDMITYILCDKNGHMQASFNNEVSRVIPYAVSLLQKLIQEEQRQLPVDEKGKKLIPDNFRKLEEQVLRALTSLNEADLRTTISLYEDYMKTLGKGSVFHELGKVPVTSDYINKIGLHEYVIPRRAPGQVAVAAQPGFGNFDVVINPPQIDLGPLPAQPFPDIGDVDGIGDQELADEHGGD
jgi:hypothetical protein